MKNLSLLLFALLVCGQITAGQSDGQNTLPLKKVTEADFTGAWIFERAEYWEHTGNTPVLRESISAPELLEPLTAHCLGEGIRAILFLGEGTIVEMLSTTHHNIECRLMETEGEKTWLELHGNNEHSPEDIPMMLSRYEIAREGESIIVLLHEVLCYDSVGVQHQNILKMFLKIVR